MCREDHLFEKLKINLQLCVQKRYSLEKNGWNM